MTKSEQAKKREMLDIFESLEFSLFEYLEQADAVVQKMFYEMRTLGVPEDAATAFLQERFKDMLEQIAEKRMPNGWELKNGGRVYEQRTRRRKKR